MLLGLQRLLYGPLRPIEIEQLYEKAWFAITETCLAMTIFREEVGGWFLVMFVGLLVGKVWAWIGEGRVEIVEQQPPANPRLFHARLSFSLLLSLAFDLALLRYAIMTVLRMARPTMMVMFAFEFAVLTISSSSTAARYAISLFELYTIQKQTQLKLEERRAHLRAERAASRTEQNAGQGPPSPVVELDEVDEADVDVPGWELKGRWVFYLDLLTGEMPSSISWYSMLTDLEWRFLEADRLSVFLLDSPYVLWSSNPHYARRVSHLTFFHQEDRRFSTISSGHQRHERAISGRGCRRD